jgi:hypothetical protein
LSSLWSRAGLRGIYAPALIAAFGLTADPAHAQQVSTSLSADQALRFGSFFTDTTGSRVVSASGSVSGTAIVPVSGPSAGPAQFTFTYDRGSNSSRTYALLVQILLPGSSPQVSGGVTGTLSAFDTDLPGVSALVPGQAVQATFTGCSRRTCIKSFRVGGTLKVSRTTGGAQLAIPLPIVVTVLAEL